MHSIVISTMITEKWKKHNRKLIETVGVRGPSTICLFLRMEKQRLRISTALTLQHIKFL